MKNPFFVVFSFCVVLVFVSFSLEGFLPFLCSHNILFSYCPLSLFVSKWIEVSVNLFMNWNSLSDTHLFHFSLSSIARASFFLLKVLQLTTTISLYSFPSPSSFIIPFFSPFFFVLSLSPSLSLFLLFFLLHSKQFLSICERWNKKRKLWSKVCLKHDETKEKKY